MLDARTLTRRSFVRHMLGAGVGILSLEFVGGSIAFLWPRAAEGIGVELQRPAPAGRRMLLTRRLRRR